MKSDDWGKKETRAIQSDPELMEELQKSRKESKEGKTVPWKDVIIEPSE